MLLSDSSPLPSYVWAVVRLLIDRGGSVGEDQARSLLSPPSLGAESTAAPPFETALRSLAELGLATEDGGRIALAESARSLSVDDVASFTDVLRRAVLAPENNEGIDTDDGQVGPRDLTRALAWFLSLDPLGGALRWKGEGGAEQKQRDALRPEVGPPLRNDFRWGRFVQWAPALGFATKPIFTGDDRAQGLAPDCTAAVRRTVLGLWDRGESVDAASAVDRIRAALPILPGGAYAESLGLSTPEGRLDGALSFALLCGDEQEWIKLERKADAARVVQVVDPALASGSRRVTHVTVLGEPNG